MGKAARRARKNENKRLAQEARERAERNRKTRKLALRVGIGVALLAILAAVLYAVNGDDDKDKVATDTSTTTAAAVECNDAKPEKAGNGKTYEKAGDAKLDAAKFYTATIETSCGTITVELDTKAAPIAAGNFVFLAREGFYDGLKFHRVVNDFMIQGGDPKGDGSSGPGYSVAGEAPKDGYQLGSIAAAKTATDPAGTMGSQFFIVTGSQGVALSNDYARFGIVTSGLDVATKMAALEKDGSQAPDRDLYILKVTISESDTSATTTTAATTSTTAAATSSSSGDTTTTGAATSSTVASTTSTTAAP